MPSSPWQPIERAARRSLLKSKFGRDAHRARAFSAVFPFRLRTISTRAACAPPQAPKSSRISFPTKIVTLPENLRAAGAILLGKTNMHEFAYGITNENPHYGPSRNPWNLDRISGGSSGGSAAAVAMGIGYASTGTDTGGSIRIPSALCGIVGLKPTFGLVSVRGIVSLAKTLDHAGPIARCVTDVCIMLQAISGDFPRGSARPDFRKLRKNRPRKFRLGWPKQYFFDRIDSEVQQAVESAAKCFESLGATFKEISLPGLERSVDPSTNIALAEATQYHESQGHFPQRAAEYSDDVRQRLELGREIRAADYLHALEVKREITEEFDSALRAVRCDPFARGPNSRAANRRKRDRDRRQKRNRAVRTCSLESPRESHRSSGAFDSVRIYAQRAADRVAIDWSELERSTTAFNRSCFRRRY